VVAPQTVALISGFSMSIAWDWRRGTKLEGSGVVPECAIKENIARDGERIYHVPGGRYYGVTVMSLDAGEQVWFCTEAEAVAAGWRRSQQ